MKGTVAPPSNNSTAAATCCGAAPNSAAICPMIFCMHIGAPRRVLNSERRRVCHSPITATTPYTRAICRWAHTPGYHACHAVCTALYQPLAPPSLHSTRLRCSIATRRQLQKTKEVFVKFRHNMVWIGCLLAATHACALTLGPTQGQVVLGAPLDIRIAVEPDADQTLESSCIDADALFGAVRAHTTLELVPPSTIRLRSRQAVNEPLVHLQVSAGCNGSSVRSYTLFADPPAGVGTKPAVTAQQPLPLATAVLPASAAATPAKRRAPSAPKNTPRSATKTPKAAKATSPAQTATASSATIAATTATAAAAVPQSNLTLESVENSRPVLGMDTLFLFPDTEGSETSPRPSTADSTVALPSPSQADTERATSEQLQQLEKQLTTLVQQQQKDRARILLLSEQLAHSQQQAPATLWLYGLMALLVLALTTIAVLLHRLRSIQSRKQADWSDTVRQAQDDAAPEAPEFIAVSQEPTKAKAKNPDAPAATDTTAQERRAFLPAAAPPDLWEQAEAPTPAPASLAKTDTEAAPSPLQV